MLKLALSLLQLKGMGTSGWFRSPPTAPAEDDWKFTGAAHGAPFAMMALAIMRRKWSASNWATQITPIMGRLHT